MVCRVEAHGGFDTQTFDFYLRPSWASRQPFLDGSYCLHRDLAIFDRVVCIH
jgi:hypothetical protein